MGDYNEGDLIEAVKGEEKITGRLSEGLRLTEACWGIDSFKSYGWTITVIEKAKPKLPEEPGVYVGSLMPDLPMWLTDTGAWFTVSKRVFDPDRHAPFTKLEPAPETAKRVLEAIEETYGENYLNNSNAGWNKVAIEFGVQS